MQNEANSPDDASILADHVPENRKKKSGKFHSNATFMNV